MDKKRVSEKKNTIRFPIVILCYDAGRFLSNRNGHIFSNIYVNKIDKRIKMIVHYEVFDFKTIPRKFIVFITILFNREYLQNRINNIGLMLVRENRCHHGFCWLGHHIKYSSLYLSIKWNILGESKRMS